MLQVFSITSAYILINIRNVLRHYKENLLFNDFLKINNKLPLIAQSKPSMNANRESYITIAFTMAFYVLGFWFLFLLGFDS